MDRVNAGLRRVPTGVVWGLLALPLLWLVWGAAFGGLGPDPVKVLERGLGEWGLRILIASLAVTPLMQAGLRLLKFRRALGVMGFVYIALHFAVWVALDMGLRWDEVLTDLSKRTYILVGLAGFVALVPLAVTSTDSAVRRMGAAAWRRLHRLAYPAILLGAVHFVMLGKVWMVESLIHLGLVVGLLALRMLRRGGRRAVPA